MQVFQDVILSQWVILIALCIVFAIVSRWAIAVFEEYPGYILGWFIALFFIIVRLSVGDMTIPEDAPTYLNGLQVFAPTILGLGIGGMIVVGLRFGLSQPQLLSIQVAIYTALNLIMIFMVFISNPQIQKMIGIFGLATGIAILFAMVMFPSPQRRQKLNIKAQGVTGNATQGTGPVPPQNPNLGQGGGGSTEPMPRSRLDKIRESQNSKIRRN